MWIGNSLESIERNYGCVAEYNRCMEERWEEEAEREYADRQSYKKNKAKLEEATKAGMKIVNFADDCVLCKHYESVGPTHGGDRDIDDIEHGICHSKKEPRETCQWKDEHMKACEETLSACDKVCRQCYYGHIPCNTCPVSEIKRRNKEELEEYRNDSCTY